MAKEDLISTLPSDIQTRKRLAKIVQEGVDCIQRQRDAGEDLKNILTVTKQDLSIDPKYLKTLIDGEYDKKVTAERKRAALENKLEQLTELDILMGRSSSEGSADV